MQRGANRPRRTSRPRDLTPRLLGSIDPSGGGGGGGRGARAGSLGSGARRGRLRLLLLGRRAGGGNLREPRPRRAVQGKNRERRLCLPAPLAVTWRGGTGKAANGFREGAVIWPEKEESFLPLRLPLPALISPSSDRRPGCCFFGNGRK